MRIRTAVITVLAFVAGTVIRAHLRDMRQLRETGIATRNFLAGKVHAERERNGARPDPDVVRTLAEYRDRRAPLDWPVDMSAVPWWEREWPDTEDPPDADDRDRGAG